MDNYKLIPMLEITDEVRKLAVAWGEKLGYDWIGDKHKLASDIQNCIKNAVEDIAKKRAIDFHKWSVDNNYYLSGDVYYQSYTSYISSKDDHYKQFLIHTGAVEL